MSTFTPVVFTRDPYFLTSKTPLRNSAVRKALTAVDKGVKHPEQDAILALAQGLENLTRRLDVDV
jgi:hypothetical protein